MINELGKDHINLKDHNKIHIQKQLVQDPIKNDLMNRFVDKYVGLISKEVNRLEEVTLEENKFPKSSFNSREESFNVLGALRANQEKQKTQKRIKCIEEIHIDTFKPEELAEVHKLKRNERHSQSMIMTEAIAASKKPSKHRRTESRSFDSATLRKIMSIDLESVERAENKRPFKK